jgi:circadian clock protein KaiC
VLDGERNRSLTIVKSRGTAHSNQVRELELSERGATLTDVYTGGGRVLMGTARMERERQLQIAAEHRSHDRERAAARLDAEIERLDGEIRGSEHALEQLRADAQRLRADDAEDDLSEALTRSLIHDERRGDAPGDEASPERSQGGGGGR